MSSSCLRLLLLASAGLTASLTPLRAAPVDLIRSAAEWSTSTAAPTTHLQFESPPGTADAAQLVIRAPAASREVGGWVRDLPAMRQGRRYRLEAACSFTGLTHPQRHVLAMLTRGKLEYLDFLTAERSGQDLRLFVEFTPVRDEPHLQLRLYLADAPGAAVTWKTAQLEDITARFRPRTARIGAIAGSPSKPKTPQDCVDFYVKKLEAIAGLGLDLVCLPENANVDGLGGDRWDWLEPIPGPTTERLGEVARRHRVYLVASLAEREGDRRRNTAVLIDRNGQVVGKYYKSHLTVGERTLSGITEGDDLPVFTTDFGKVGLLICWDYHFPEPARILALKGAELILLPNAGDGRERGTLWEAGMRIRAVDNHVYLASAVNSGPSLIVSPKGAILARNDRTTAGPGGLIHAECELGESVANWTRESIGKRYLLVRRPDIYQTLAHDLDGEPRAK